MLEVGCEDVHSQHRADNAVGAMASVPNSSSSAPPPPVWDAHPTAAHVAYGGFWIRLVAYIIDVILLTVAYGVIGSVLGVNIFAPDLEHYSPTANIVSFLIGWLYF